MASVPWGGSEVLWSEACRKLAADGHEVFAWYPWWPTLPAPLTALASDFKVEIAPYSARRSFTKRVAGRIRRRLRMTGLMGSEHRWLRGVRPDILCISSGNATEGASWMQIAVEEQVPFVAIAQAHVEFFWPSDDQADSLISLLNSARKCFFVSHGNLRLFQTQLGATLTNAEVISNHGAVSWKDGPDWPDAVDGIWRLALVGRLHPSSKGQDLLIEVLSQRRWRGLPIVVSFYGVGPQERILHRLVESNALQDQIRFCGHVDNIAKIWRHNHALIMPSRYEGLPLALVEALICGRTAIVTDVGGNAEVVEHGVTGFVAEAAAVVPLARAMEEAWEERHRWREMGQRARERMRIQIPEDPGADLAARLINLAG